MTSINRRQAFRTSANLKIYAWASGSNEIVADIKASESKTTEQTTHTQLEESTLIIAIMPPRFNIPPITRILLITLVLQSAISFAIRYPQWSSGSDVVLPYVTLVPQLSLKYPWTFLTTTLVENNIFTFAIAGATLFYGGRYLERAWTSVEFGKFLLVASLIPNILTFGTLVILFAITGDMHWTYVYLYPGFSGGN